MQLPKPISAYFDADRLDAEAVVGCFTEGATVKDEGHTHIGLSAIKKWKSDSAAKYTYTTEPLSVDRKGKKTVVTSRLTGNFPGSPVELRFIFELDGEKIASLEIVP